MSVSAFFQSHRARLSETRDLGPVLDLACGRGRHALACAADGLATLALDRDLDHLRAVAHAREGDGDAAWGRLDCVRADVESAPEIPFLPSSCGAVLVFRFLFRPLAPRIVELLAPGGLLLYETFTTGQRALGFGPSRDAFLLEPGELPGLFPGLEVLVYEEGLSDEDRPSHTARLLARRV